MRVPVEKSISPSEFFELVKGHLPEDVLPDIRYEADEAAPSIGIFWKQMRAGEYLGSGLYREPGWTWDVPAKAMAKRLLALRRGFPIGYVIKDELPVEEAQAIAHQFLDHYKGQRQELINSRHLIDGATDPTKSRAELEALYAEIRDLFGDQSYGVQNLTLAGSQRRFDIYRAYRDLARHVKRRLEPPKPDEHAPTLAPRSQANGLEPSLSRD